MCCLLLLFAVVHTAAWRCVCVSLHVFFISSRFIVKFYALDNGVKSNVCRVFVAWLLFFSDIDGHSVEREHGAASVIYRVSQSQYQINWFHFSWKIRRINNFLFRTDSNANEEEDPFDFQFEWGNLEILQRKILKFQKHKKKTHTHSTKEPINVWRKGRISKECNEQPEHLVNVWWNIWIKIRKERVCMYKTLGYVWSRFVFMVVVVVVVAPL